VFHWLFEKKTELQKLHALQAEVSLIDWLFFA
jgi:hypothetical protein